MAVEDFHYLLFHLSPGQQIGPSLFILLSSEKPQVMPDFAQHWFGLFFDLRKQHFLSAHAIIIHKNAGQASYKLSPSPLCQPMALLLA
jgi:hypothetical protein